MTPDEETPEVYQLPVPDAVEGYDPPGSTEEDDPDQDGHDGCACTSEES